MAEITVAEAARRVGKTRKTLYRLRDSGKLSFTKNTLGKCVIDESELARVFPTECQINPCDSPVSGSDNVYANAVTALTQQLEESLEREKWLRARLEEVERERAALAQRLLPPGNTESAQTRKSWWQRIFG